MKKGLFGFLMGSLFGAGLAVLYAPQSGDDTRELLNQKSEALKKNALDSFQEAQESALTKLDEIQGKFDELNKEANQFLDRMKDIGEATFTEQEDVVIEGFNEKPDFPPAKDG